MLYWDAKVQRYRDRFGRFVDQKTIHGAIEDLISATKKEARRLSRQLANRKIGLGVWQLEMRDLLRSAHAIAGGIGHGGRGRLTDEALARIGHQLMEQFAHLNRFGLAIEKGQLSSLQIEFRAQMYGNALRGTFFEGEKRVRGVAGYRTCKRVLRARESCSDCLDWAGRGYVGLDEQPKIGTLKCQGGCHCYLIYRK